MKKVLVIGENSYIGKSFAEYAKDRFSITMVSSRDSKWKDADFTGYDSVLHCAGIAHVSQKANMEKQYYGINCDLAVEVAKKARDARVNQFIFLSSMSVYGSKTDEIDCETPPNPDGLYGHSKLKAEKKLHELADDDFKLCIIRPPMVYGKDCPGNFPRLVKLAKRTPIFPDYPNKRSMIYIENLCEFIAKTIDNNSSGIHLPQNALHVNTTTLVKCISHLKNKRELTLKLFNPIISMLAKHINPINKLFGNLIYVYNGNEKEYNIVEFEESIKRSIDGNGW